MTDCAFFSTKVFTQASTPTGIPTTRMSSVETPAVTKRTGGTTKHQRQHHVDSGGGELREPTLGCAKGSAIETARGAGTRADSEVHSTHP